MSHNELFDRIASALDTTFVNADSQMDDILTDNMNKACEQPRVIEEIKAEIVTDNETTLDNCVEHSQTAVNHVQTIPATHNIPQSQTHSNNSVSMSQPNDVAPIEDLMEDKRFIQNELYTSISQVGEVMMVMKEGLKSGSRSSEFEAFARLNDSLVNTLDKLATLNLKLADKRAFAVGMSNPANQQNNQTLIFNGADMLDKIIELRKKGI